MAWDEARNALKAALENVARIDVVHLAPPESYTALGDVSAVLLPPQRSTTRRPGDTEATYNQRIQILAAAGPDIEAASIRLDNTIEAVIDEMEEHVTLSGEATYCGPFEFSEATVVEYPPGSGAWFVSMIGTASITVTSSAARAA